MKLLLCKLAKTDPYNWRLMPVSNPRYSMTSTIRVCFLAIEHPLLSLTLDSVFWITSKKLLSFPLRISTRPVILLTECKILCSEAKRLIRHTFWLCSTTVSIPVEISLPNCKLPWLICRLHLHLFTKDWYPFYARFQRQTLAKRFESPSQISTAIKRPSS